MNIEGLIWYLVLTDALIANLGAWIFPKWYKKTFHGLWNHLPLSKAWTALYLIIVLWLGYALMRLGIIF